jgi:drug/metabolite transporter (DMT)-like permease
MPPQSRLRVWLPVAGLVLTVAIWSSNNIVSKVIMQEASPPMVALVRFTLAGVFFYLPVFLALHHGRARFTKAEWPRLAVLGVVGTAGSLVLYLLGLKTIPATEAGIYQVTLPLFTVVIAWLWLGERLSRGRTVGVLLAAVGASALATGGAVGTGGGDPSGSPTSSMPGAFFILGSNLTWSVYTIVSKEILKRRSPLLVLAAANLLAAVAIWPAAGLLGVWPELPNVLNWSPTAWIVMLYLVALMSTSSQWLYVRCLREVRASQASASLYLMPFFTAIMAAVFLGEQPTPLTLIAGLLILVGVGLVNRPQETRQPAAPARLRLGRATGK